MTLEQLSRETLIKEINILRDMLVCNDFTNESLSDLSNQELMGIRNKLIDAHINENSI